MVSWGPGRLDVFVRGSDKKLWHNWWENGWGNWEAPYTFTDIESSPVAASWAAGQLGIIFGATGGKLGSVGYF